MFFVSYAFLLIVCAATLWIVIRRPNNGNLAVRSSTMPSALYVILLAGAVICLTIGSLFEYKYVAGGYLIASMFIDLCHFSRAEDQSKAGETPKKLSQWWEISDACAWLILINVLFYA